MRHNHRLLLLVLFVLALVLAWVRRRRSQKRLTHIVEAPTLSKSTEHEDTSSFSAFLSHYKIEAATEARWLKAELEALLDKRCFLDSDDLSDLSRLKGHVRESDCVLLLQTRSGPQGAAQTPNRPSPAPCSSSLTRPAPCHTFGPHLLTHPAPYPEIAALAVLTRPWCIVELLTAIESDVPIVGVSIKSGQAPYDFAMAVEWMTHLDTLLDDDKAAQLDALGIDLVDASFKLANTLPNIISLPLDMHESRAILTARVREIVAAMGKAKLPEGAPRGSRPAERAAWLEARNRAAARPGHGLSSAPRSQSQSQPVAAAGLASLPTEVPRLPEKVVARPQLIEALKACVLRDGAAPTAVTASSASSSGNTTTAAGMGGIGKTMMAAALARDNQVRAAFSTICWVSVGQEPDVLSLQRTLHRQLTNQPLPEAAQADELVALGVLKEAAKEQGSVLLLLDDVWVAAHTTPLNFVEGGATLRSAVVVTTRIRSLLDGATPQLSQTHDLASLEELSCRQSLLLCPALILAMRSHSQRASQRALRASLRLPRHSQDTALNEGTAVDCRRRDRGAVQCALGGGVARATVARRRMRADARSASDSSARGSGALR